MKHIIPIALLIGGVAQADPVPPEPPASALTRADVRPTACGDGGIGEVYAGPRAGTIERREGLPGYRVNDAGFWAVGCAMPKPTAPPPAPKDCRAGAPAFWSVDGRTCSTTSSRRRLDHGEHALYLQQTGPTRGQVVEQCVDGKARQVSAVCEVATHCDTRVNITRGGRSYTYDGVRSPVPLGGSASAASEDGSKWPVSCVAGDWSAPAVLPRPAAPAASRPVPVVLPGCGPQTLTRGGLTTVYSGPRVDEGRTVIVRLGMRYVPAWCRDGRLSLDPPIVTPQSAASSADVWRGK